MCILYLQNYIIVFQKYDEYNELSDNKLNKMDPKYDPKNLSA